MAAAIEHADGRLQLDPDVAGTAAARQSVSIATADRGKQHHLGFSVHGAPGDGIRLKIGTTEGGTELFAGIFNPGHHFAAFTPDGATAYVQFEKPGGWPAQIDDVKLLRDEPLELATPWVQEAVDELRFDQSNDIMTVCHRDFQPCDIVRTAENAFSLEFFANVDGPYLDENPEEQRSMTPGGTAGDSVQVTAGSGLFEDTDVWRHLTIKHGDTWGWGLIREVTSATVAVVQVKRAFGEATASAAWRLGAWNEAVGYPAAVTYHDGRQVFAGGTTAALRRRVDASAAIGFNIFTPGAGDDGDAWTRELSVQGGIRHLVSARQLLALTTDEERALSGDGLNAAITPQAFRDTAVGRHGASAAVPISLGHVTLFVDRSRRSLVELLYDALTEGYEGPDLLLLAQHLTRGGAARGITALAHVENPWSLALAARDDGALLALTYLRAEQVTGWSQFRIADGKGRVESVAVIPGDADDEVWLAVRYESPTGRLYVGFDSLEALTGLFTRASTGDNTGAWYFEEDSNSTQSLETGPGVSNRELFVATDTSNDLVGSDDSIFATLEANGVLTLDMTQFGSATARVLRLMACVMGEFDNDDEEGLRVQWRADAADDWTTALLINGWAHPQTLGTPVYDAGDAIAQYRTGASLVCALDGGWVDFEAAIPDEAVEVRLAPRLIGGNPVKHDIALRSAVLEWAGEEPGATRRYVERLTWPLPNEAAPEEAFYVDSGLTLDAPERWALTPGAATGAGVTFTADRATFFVLGGAGDVGRFIRHAWQPLTATGLPERDRHGFPVFRTAVAEIAAVTSRTEVTADIVADFPSTDAIPGGGWRMTVTVVTGLDHLEGETVAVFGDGRQQADRVVRHGAIRLETPAAHVHVGRRYSWRWVTLPLELGARLGTSQGQPANIHRISVRTVRTRNIEAGVAGEDGFLYAADAPETGQADPLTSGDVLLSGTGWQRSLALSFGHDGAYPATIVLVVPHSEVGEVT